MFCPKCGTGNSEEAKFCAGCGAPLTPLAEAPAGESQSTPKAPVRYAGFWFRVLAAIIDGILVEVASIVIVFPLGFALGASMAGTSTPDEIGAAGGALGFIVGIIVQWLWFTIGESSKWQASLGKKLLGLKVTDENGERISFARANGRYWSKILSAIILMIGFLMVAFTEKKQGLHDKIAGTLVVRD